MPRRRWAKRIVGQAPLQAKVYHLEKLRCNLCGKVFTAEAPEGVGAAKYDATAGSMMALLKYGTGMPFHRAEKLQESLGIPVPASTQWDVLREQAKRAEPVFEELVRQAAQGEVLHVATGQGHRIALFFSGRQHAGENLRDVLTQRAAGLPPPIQMCDALSRNLPGELATILAHCLAHGRRQFVE